MALNDWQKKSFEFIAIVIAVRRVLLLLQHVIVKGADLLSRLVNMYARRTISRSTRFPVQLLIVPCSLAISTGLFFAGYAVTEKHGEESKGAKIKFILWGSGLLWPSTKAGRVYIVKRFNSITTIIVGEGINAIAQTFYVVEKAPAFSKSIIASIISSAVIIFFLVYLYFEGAAPLSQPLRRRAAWAMVHLPWLLSVILLLEGVKNQLLLTNFINSADYVLEQNFKFLTFEGSHTEFDSVLYKFRDVLLRAGMTWDDEVQKYNNLYDQNATATHVTQLDDSTENDVFQIWCLRLQMSSVLNIYLAAMGNDTIEENIHKMIYQYQNDYAYTYQDYAQPEYNIILPEIVWELMKPSVDNTRYVMALSGLTFTSLATLNLIQSWPRDRFQWLSIITRYAIGVSMTLLLVLNIGKYQEYIPPGDVPDSKRAAVFNWIDA
ncbi:hypothetical protein FRC12_006644 [Ceratobasidium sp. 428]|nr:hypothetical protein FRC12_006644 [Ceratobasidium sp. 428]